MKTLVDLEAEVTALRDHLAAWQRLAHDRDQDRIRIENEAEAEQARLQEQQETDHADWLRMKEERDEAHRCWNEANALITKEREAWEAERAALQQQLENEAYSHEATRHELRQWVDEHVKWRTRAQKADEALTAERAVRAALVPYLWHKANCDVARSRCKCGLLLGSHSSGGCGNFRQRDCTCGLDTLLRSRVPAPSETEKK